MYTFFILQGEWDDSEGSHESLPGLALFLTVAQCTFFLPFTPTALISLYYFSYYDFEIDNYQNPQTIMKSNVFMWILVYKKGVNIRWPER